MSSPQEPMTAFADADVRNLIDEYCYHVMTADADAWALTWAEDATWSVPGAGTMEGRGDIRRVFDEIRSTYAFCVQELLGLNIQIDRGGQRAETRCVVRELQWSKRDEQMVGSELIGVYEDTVINSASGPVFSKRDFALLYSGPVDLTGRFHKAAFERSKYLSSDAERVKQ